jgi:hypothetical protein
MILIKNLFLRLLILFYIKDILLVILIICLNYTE